MSLQESAQQPGSPHRVQLTQITQSQDRSRLQPRADRGCIRKVTIPPGLPQGLRCALAACWAGNASRYGRPTHCCKQSPGQSSRRVGWSCAAEGQPVGHIADPLYRKAELCTAPRIQVTKLKPAPLAAVRPLQGGAQGFRRDTIVRWVRHGISPLTDTTTSEKANEQNSIATNLLH